MYADVRRIFFILLHSPRRLVFVLYDFLFQLSFLHKLLVGDVISRLETIFCS